MTPTPAPPPAQIKPITDFDLSDACDYIRAKQLPQLGNAACIAAFRHHWDPEKPNNGFMLQTEAGRIVGLFGALYARRIINGQERRICNVTTWVVDDAYRPQSLGLLQAIIAQPGYAFLNTSANETAEKVFTWLGFTRLDPQVRIIPHIGLPGWGYLTTDPDAIARGLSDQALEIFNAHRGKDSYLNCRHVGVGRRDNLCHVMYTRTGRFDVRLPCLVIHYVSDPALFLRYLNRLKRHFLLRDRAAYSLIETRLYPTIAPLLSRVADDPIVKLAKSDVDPLPTFDNLYTEWVA
ncbi:hypothetical protein MAIT1_04649 [Magnetofaba australis IT-1]|uniref:N-acetyltransferase domain-containing protein n=1 Tax=Magnetofaba australis IT-1 TaxID=1434232 RepID=A0A1Y2KAI2_9PROT|nr:hypothetical protein MAIT1_04649 [Magnetofaba australis IT-1]